MGTMPLFRPNTGINTKLWSLKYAPNTAVAVFVKPKRILFMPKVMMELMDCMTMEGNPTR